MINSAVASGGCAVNKYNDAESNLSLARAHLGILNSIPQPIFSKTKDKLILFDGELYNNETALSDPEHVLDLYSKVGGDCVYSLEGIFAFVICDFTACKVKIFNDRFGLKPIYYYNDFKEGLIFASEIKSILQIPFVEKQRDDSAVADLLTFGFVMGDKTLIQDIKLVPPASCLAFDFKTGDSSLKKYWELKELFMPKGQRNLKVSDDDVVDAFICAVKKRCKNKEILGLALSGGKDTRAMLAAMGNETSGLKTYTVGIKGCIDEWVAQKLSIAAKTKHKFIELDVAYLNNFEKYANSMIYLSDGFYMPHELTEMLVLDYLKAAPFKILIRGHGGEIAKAHLLYPANADQETLKLKQKNEILSRLFEKLNHLKAEFDLKKLFTPALYSEIEKTRINRLDSCLGEAIEALNPADVFIYLYMREFVTKGVVPSLEIFRNAAEIRLPFMDYEFLKLLLQLPIERRWKGEIQYKAIKKCSPLLMKVPDSNTRAPLDAGIIRTFVSDKTISLLRRLNIKGFRHYTRFEKWYSDEFMNAVKGILLNGEARKRDLFNLGYLEEILSKGAKNQVAFGNFVGTLVGIEFWHRNFLD
jgi:asparagine synthase (glutamine-hydrolysing)